MSESNKNRSEGSKVQHHEGQAGTYLVTHRDNGWAVKKEGAQRASGVFPTQREAERRAKELVARLGGGEVRIQARAGKFTDSLIIGKGDLPVRSTDRPRGRKGAVRGGSEWEETRAEVPADVVAEPVAASVASPPSLSTMIEAMMPASVPTPAAVLQARRNSAARTALIEELGLLTSAEVAELNQSEAENRAALASRWKREGRIFSVKHRGRDYFPGFQLDREAKPRPVIAEVLARFDGGHGWETALWFTAPNGYLDGRRPVDLLAGDPEAVVEAAEHEAAEIYF